VGYQLNADEITVTWNVVSSKFV